MDRLYERNQTARIGWLGATLLGVLTIAVVTTSFSMAPACAHADPAAQSGQSAQLRPVKVTNATKNQKTKHRRRSSKGRSASSSAAVAAKPNKIEPELRALTPHSDLTPGQKADAEVNSVLRYGARKHAEGNYEEAEAAFRHVLSRDPSNVDAFYDLGALAERRGDVIAALSSYRAALALKPHDKEITEAVQSMEKKLRSQPAFSFREGHRQTVPVSGPLAPTAPILSSPVLSSPVLPGAFLGNYDNFGDLPPLVASPQLGPALSVDPGLSVDPANVANPAAAPGATSAPGTFQLSSAKNGLLAPTLGVTPASASLPATPPVVGAAPRSHPVARMFLNTALNQGASIGLRAAGLHCPACHLMRFRF